MERPKIFYQVSAFGGLQITCPDGSVAKLQTHRARALFVLLLINRARMVHREALYSMLWPDLAEASARSQFRKTLWRIRSALLPPGPEPDTPVIRIAEHQVGLDDTQIEADYWRFADTMGPIELKGDAELDDVDAKALLVALGLNSDTFAAGIFDEWCLAEQEAMRQARLEAMERMVGYHRAQEHWVQAIHWAQQALVLDPIREHLHHAVMACRYSMGDRASAIRQYMLCEEVLNRELGIAPSPELRAFCRRITREDDVDAAPGQGQKAGRGKARDPRRLAHEVDAAISSLSAVRDSLEKLSSDI